MKTYDDIVIGSGLSALAVVAGLPARRRVLVIGGPAIGHYIHYAGGTAPCAYLGMGGLGNAWHGVIPMAAHPQLAPDGAAFAQLFEWFYPGAAARARAGSDVLFVPRRPIRPREQFELLARQRGAALELHTDLATRFEADGAKPRVFTAESVFEASRLWIAAGALHTPALLERSLQMPLARQTVADHASCYIGHVDGLPPVAIEQVAGGMYIPAHLAAPSVALYMLRPARFSFRRLDQGIEQRAAFGLPTGSAVAKILRAMSAGLVAEALYNRFGMFARAARYSIYAQVEVPDAYEIQRDAADGAVSLLARTATIRQRTDAARAAVPFPAVMQSQRPDLYVPGIHLHHSVDLDALQGTGIGAPESRIQIVDASVMRDIGPAHHSFRMMLGAWQKARLTG